MWCRKCFAVIFNLKRIGEHPKNSRSNLKSRQSLEWIVKNTLTQNIGKWWINLYCAIWASQCIYLYKFPIHIGRWLYQIKPATVWLCSLPLGFPQITQCLIFFVLILKFLMIVQITWNIQINITHLKCPSRDVIRLRPASWFQIPLTLQSSQPFFFWCWVKCSYWHSSHQNATLAMQIYPNYFSWQYPKSLLRL